MKRYLAILALLFLASCKPKAVLAEGNASTTISAEKIIENHYNNKTDFSSLYIKASAHYEDAKNSQNVAAEIRIKKDEKILVIIRVIGITMAKALITPTSVQYYDKIGNKYFEGDYAGLSKWLGTDLDYQKVQNLLIGRAIDDLHKGKFVVSIMEKLYKLQANDGKAEKAFYFESDNFLIKRQEINQPSLDRTLQVVYPDFKKYDEAILPLSLSINARQSDNKTNIEIEYKNSTFNEELSFPYNVPEGYERIYIDKN
ncbi:DUF4292 domain-containing protein [Flavobacterium sp. SUN052]|uniref:DUF4292 domain-containing protein n=1 Tax=Flavobacterium sp. SUN052 TaxID=3002441 RepID=UPI00237E0566|nr:DUF4292 domain-containing protein [Flavobacterium sp. SUN052]MEC4003464.1 DUF4292 domain-containing protein [Flavobacterium sp. SUN052]